MKQEEEAAVTASRESSFESNLAQKLALRNKFDREVWNLVFGERVVSSNAPAYLTYTDKSPSTPVKNHDDFKHFSVEFYLETMDLFKTNKKLLQRWHMFGFARLKYINTDRLILYKPPNPVGNAYTGWELAKEDSNTDKARFASKNAALEKALCNVDVWEYFATFTLDKKKQDRHDFQKTFKHVVKFLQNRHIRYFLVPERHKDGAWHYHALLSAELGPYLADFDEKAKKNWYIAKCLAEGKAIKQCEDYSQIFGYNIVEPCRNKEACSYYMTKYVLKTFDDPNFERVSRRRYFTSKGLKNPRIINPVRVNLNEFEPVAFSGRINKVTLRRITPERFFSDQQKLLNLVESPPPLKEKESESANKPLSLVRENLS